MSFYTSLNYFRPQPPPRITTRELADVVRRIYSAAEVTPNIMTGMRVKFGRAIDKDAKPTLRETETAPGVFTVRSIEYDINHNAKSCEQLVAELLESDSIVYRANIYFGCAADSICKLFTRANSPENAAGLCLSDLSLHIGPIHAATLADDAPRHVGWIALTLSGQGYLFPWTREEILKRTQQSNALNALTQICSDAWPIDPHTLRGTKNIRGLLKRMRKAIGQETVDTLNAWQWDIKETG